jgi:hypothetical protein
VGGWGGWGGWGGCTGGGGGVCGGGGAACDEADGRGGCDSDDDGGGGACDGVEVDDEVVRAAAPITSLATDFPAAATPESTPMALFNNPIVSAIVVAETRPALRLSSTPSVKRWKTFGDCDVLSAYFDSRNST